MTAPRNPSALVYRTLLWLLPASLRSDYGEPMLDAFAAMQRDRAWGVRPAIRFWRLVVGDFFMTLGREWRMELVMTNWRAHLSRLVGLAGMAGAVGWFVVLIAPQWNPAADLGWSQTGGYQPRALILASLLLAVGLGGGALREGRDWPRLRLLGTCLLVASVGLIAIQAPVPMGGVSFSATPAAGLGVYLLPVSIAVLAIDAARAPVARPPETRLRRAAAVVVSLVAVGLSLPFDPVWYDTWDFVLRSAFIFPTLAIALVLGYRSLGGPRLELRVVRPSHAEVA